MGESSFGEVSISKLASLSGLCDGSFSISGGSGINVYNSKRQQSGESKIEKALAA
jgi:hypothetical protein